MRDMISTHPATVLRGTDPGEVAFGRDAIMTEIEANLGTAAAFEVTNIEAYADGDLGYIYGEIQLTPDGAEFSLRGLWVAHREDGSWRFVHGLIAVPVPNELLVAGSPLAVATA
jgi:ketosteroid isomerase-like protein